MSIGLILLIALAILILFGALQRVLDRMRLTDRQALLFTALIFIGGLIPDISFGEYFSINLGGAVVPFGLCVYLFIKAETGKEKLRAILAAIIGGAAVFFTAKFMPAEPEQIIIDPNYIYGIEAGLLAYVFGRSRRAAFIGGTMGVLIADIVQGLISFNNGINAKLALGGGGGLDAIVISGIIAVLLADLIGELIERVKGGTKHDDMSYHDGHFIRNKGRKHK